MEELKAQIKILEERLAKLEGQMSYDDSEALKDRFFSILNTSAEQTVALSGNAQNIEVPVSSGTISLAYKGKIYKLLYE